jgi:hypothetical protein
MGVNPEKGTEFAHGGFFTKLPSETTLNSGHRFCVIELDLTRGFLGLSGYINVMTTVAFPVAIGTITLPLLHHTKNVFNFSFQ